MIAPLLRKFIWGRGAFLRLCPVLLRGWNNISIYQNVTYFGFGVRLKNHRFRLSLCVMIVLLLLPALIFRSGLLNFTCMSGQAYNPPPIFPRPNQGVGRRFMRFSLVSRWRDFWRRRWSSWGKVRGVAWKRSKSYKKNCCKSSGLLIVLRSIQ